MSVLVQHADPTAPKGWYAGPWNSALRISIGYANAGIDEPHGHTRLTEIYMVARGTSTIRVETTTVVLEAGDIIAIEPGEAHTFLSSSPDYFHFVAHVPDPSTEGTAPDKYPVPRSRLAV